jgi:hypothetical protein
VLRTNGTGPTAAITNCTLTGNTAGQQGGGIDAGLGVAVSFGLTLLNDTINGNFSGRGGGIFWAGIGSVTVQNTIIAQNTAITAGPDTNNPEGTFTDNGGNLIGIAGTGSGNTGFTAATTQTGTVATPLNPLLAALANNGGLTIGAPGLAQTLMTEALLGGSPALDKGVSAGAPSTDARGFVRPDAGAAELPDDGAFESQDVTLSVRITPASATVSQGSSATFNVTVTNTSGNALPADNSAVTVTLPAGLTATSPVTFILGPLAAGQATTFAVTAAAAALGSQTVTAAVTSPDASPNTVSVSTMVSVVAAPAPPPGGTGTGTAATSTTPVGALTAFAVGFGPGFALELFEVDSQGHVFTQGLGLFGSGGSPVFIADTLQFSAAAFVNGQLLAMLRGNDQLFLVDVFNLLNPFVNQALLASAIDQMLLASPSQ